jgi:Tfp pilus assembly protein PilO
MARSESKNSEQSKIQLAFIRRYALSAGAIVVICAAWLILYFLPLQKQINEASKGVEEWEKKIKAASVSQEAIDGLSDRVASLKDELTNIEKRIFYLSDMPEIASKLVRYGRSHRLKITSMTPNYDVLFDVGELHSQGKPLVKVPLSLKMSGRYISLGGFISEVSSLPFVFSPDGFFLEANPEIHPRIDITVTGFLFLLNEEKKKLSALHDRSPVRESKG